MRLRTRTLGIGLAVASVLSLGALTATSALAGTGGNPYPTPSPTETVKCPPGTVLVGDRCEPVRPTLQQQEFDIKDGSGLAANGWVLGTGPISILAGIDRQVPGNDRVDFLDTADGTSGVRINHEPLGGNVFIDRRTCSVMVIQFDQPWSIHQGFGRFLGAVGNGVYDLTGLWSFPTKNNYCTLPRGLTVAQALDNFNGLPGAITLPDPLAVSVDVQAVGRSFVPFQVPNPCPTPTRSVFAPTGKPTGEPTVCPSPTRSVFAPVGSPSD